MIFTTKTHGAFVLLMTLFFAKISAARPCSGYQTRRFCTDQEGVCHWVRRTQRCVDVPTEDECAEKEKKLSCRKVGCSWNDDDGLCHAQRSSTDRPNIDDAPERDENDPHEEFWFSLRGMDPVLAKSKTEDKFGNEYHVYICGNDQYDDQDCFDRDLDITRVRLWVREQNINKVKKVVIG